MKKVRRAKIKINSKMNLPKMKKWKSINKKNLPTKNLPSKKTIRLNNKK